MRVARFVLTAKARLTPPAGTTCPADGLRRATPDGGRAARKELARLEAGGDAIVHGWALGIAGDDSRYVLSGDGALTPYDENEVARPAKQPKKRF